jgi:subfamily B ATP-binding cassette protein MsbA
MIGGWVRPYWLLAVLGVVLTMPTGSMDAVIAAFLRPYIDHVVIGKSQLASANIPLLIIAFTLLQGCLIYAATYVNAWVGNRITVDVKRQLFHKLLAMDTGYFDQNSTGNVLFRYSTDVDVACGGLVTNVRSMLTRFFSILCLAGVLFYNSWWLALLAIGIVGCAFGPLRLIRQKLREATSAAQAGGAAATACYSEFFAGNRTVAAYNLQRHREKQFESTTGNIFRQMMAQVRHSNFVSPAMHLITATGLAAVLWLGGWLVTTGEMSEGSFAAFIASLLLMYAPLKNFGTNLQGIQGSMLALERIREKLATVPAIPTAFTDAVEPLAICDGIRFEGVSFAYGDGQPVLSSVDFHVPVGQTVGIVGSSGGGKSTIVHLLLRLYDVGSGRITIDGRDLRELPVERLRRSIAVVFQDNFLFSTTIRENIRVGNLAASEEALQLAVRAANLLEFANSLPQGLETQVGERGMLLSGGQKQRIAIARAILRDAPIVLLDEATSALDNLSEAIVQDALQNLMVGRTVLIVAHRLSTITHAHRILVVDGGRIVEQGSHGELLAIPAGIYAGLFLKGNGR